MQIVTHHGSVSRMKLLDLTLVSHFFFYFLIRYISLPGSRRRAFCEGMRGGFLARVGYSNFYPIICIFLGCNFRLYLCNSRLIFTKRKQNMLI